MDTCNCEFCPLQRFCGMLIHHRVEVDNYNVPKNICPIVIAVEVSTGGSF